MKDRKEEVAIKDITVKDPILFEEWKKEVDVMRSARVPSRPACSFPPRPTACS